MRRLTETDKAYESIRSLILTCQLSPGERTSAAMLAELTGHSLAPVREAITRLVTQGFLETSHRLGTFVAQLGEREIAELFEMRNLIESHVSQNVVGISETACDDLQALFDRMEIASRQLYDDPRSIVTFVDLDVSFHTALVQALSNNGRLVDTYKGLQLHLQIALYLFRQRRSFVADRHQEHRAILDAVISRDQAALQSMLQSHSDRVRDLLIK